MKKIAFIGTHGTGKTTSAYRLAGDLKRQGVNAEILYEVARKCPLPINEARTPSAQRWIVLAQIIAELEFEKSAPEILVCDRSVLDNYAYFVSAFGHDEALDAIVKSHIKTYDLLFRTKPLPGKIEADSVRSTDKEFQELVDKTVDDLLGFFGVETREFITYPLALGHVLKRIDDYNKDTQSS
jgi:nicotinamide riboside kinase